MARAEIALGKLARQRTTASSSSGHVLGAGTSRRFKWADGNWGIVLGWGKRSMKIEAQKSVPIAGMFMIDQVLIFATSIPCHGNKS